MIIKDFSYSKISIKNIISIFSNFLFQYEMKIAKLSKICYYQYIKLNKEKTMPRARFSDKYGFTTPRDVFQSDDIDEALKNRLWNAIKNYFIDTLVTPNNNDRYAPHQPQDKKFIIQVYDEFFKDNIDPLKYSRKGIRDNLKKRYFDLTWFEIYNFLEFLSYAYYSSTTIYFYKKVNQILEEENSAYRFVDEFITPIVEEIEIAEIEEAMSSKYQSVTQHLSRSLELFSDKEKPDYTNSIKESISAVESLCKILTDNQGSPLGACLSRLDSGVGQHFKDGLKKLYNWTSSEHGIRHGSTREEIQGLFDEAKYMLVMCSAFINYIISKDSAQ